MHKKNQNKIQFENLHTKHLGGWWGNSPIKSLGNIIHWLYTYGTLDIAEQVTVGDGEVHWFGRLMVKFKYTEENPEIPFFYDLEYPEYEFIMINQEKYLQGLKDFSEFAEKYNERYNETRKAFGLK